MTEPLVLDVFLASLFIFLVNLPFGYLRGNKKPLSLLWFLYIHLPVPVVILIRERYGLELTWELAPFLLGSYLLGQWLGKYLRSKIDLFKKQ